MNIVYLDMNLYNRPYDDQGQARIRLETVAIFEIFQHIRHGTLTLLWSFILDYENRLNPYVERRIEIDLLSQLASETIHSNEQIRQLAHQFEPCGVKPRDALHLACAVSGRADYFLTCDDKLLNKRAIPGLAPMCLHNPIDFILQHGG